MKRKHYMQPTVCAVKLRYRSLLLMGSVKSVTTNLTDDISIDDTSSGGFSGR